MEVPKTATELRERLAIMFRDLLTGAMTRAEATEPNNTAGKILSTVKLQLENAKLRKESPNIDFLKCN